MVLCCLLVLAFGVAQSSAHTAGAKLAPCADARALESLDRFSAAELAYLRELSSAATIGCAQQGLTRLALIKKNPCASAEVLASVGERESSHAAYLKTLEVEPTSGCAARGAKATSSTASVWSWFGDATNNGGKVLTLVVLAALALGILALLWLHGQTRIPGLRDLPPASWIRRPALQIAAFDDNALSEHLGQSIAGLVRGQVSLRKDRFGVNLVSGQAGVASALGDLGGISTETSAAVAVVNFLATRLPRRRFVLGGALQPAGGEGPGLSLELDRQQNCEALITFWAASLKIDSDPAPRAYQSLAVAAAAWADHTVANALGGDDLLTADPQSWAYFRCGVDAQRLGDDPRARALYKLALVKDGSNLGALANLGIICRTQNEYESAEWYLAKALKVAEDPTLRPKLAAELNPDWYRIKHQLAAVYLNWAADTAEEMTDTKRAALKTKAICEGRDAALSALNVLTDPPAARQLPSPQYLDRTLRPFLTGTFVPSVLGLVASAVYPLSRPPRSQSPGGEKRTRPTLTQVLETLKSDQADQVDPWLLVDYVEGGEQLPPNAQSELACFYTLVTDHTAAAIWLRRAIRDAPDAEQKILIEVAGKDSTLAPLREAQPELIAKLTEEFGEDTTGVGAGARQSFDFRRRVQEWLVDDDWTVVWMPAGSQFTFQASKDRVTQLIELASGTNALTSDDLDRTIGRLTSFKTANPALGDVRARIMVPREPPPSAGIDYAAAAINGVDVEQSRHGSFQVVT